MAYGKMASGGLARMTRSFSNRCYSIADLIQPIFGLWIWQVFRIRVLSPGPRTCQALGRFAACIPGDGRVVGAVLGGSFSN